MNYSVSKREEEEEGGEDRCFVFRSWIRIISFAYILPPLLFFLERELQLFFVEKKNLRGNKTNEQIHLK